MAGRSSGLLDIEEEVEEIRAEIARLPIDTSVIERECVEVEHELVQGNVAVTNAISMIRTLDPNGTPRSQRRLREHKRDMAAIA